MIKLCQDAVKSANESFEKLLRIPTKDQTFQNTRVAFERTIERFFDSTLPLTFIGYVFVNDLGGEGIACSKKVSEFLRQTYSRPELFDLFKNHHGSTQAEIRLEETTFKKEDHPNLDQDESVNNQLHDLGTRIGELTLKYIDNVNHASPVLEFSKKDLAGMPERFFKDLKKENGKYLISVTENTYLVHAEHSKIFCSQRHSKRF